MRPACASTHRRRAVRCCSFNSRGSSPGPCVCLVLQQQRRRRQQAATAAASGDGGSGGSCLLGALLRRHWRLAAATLQLHVPPRQQLQAGSVRDRSNLPGAATQDPPAGAAIGGTRARRSMAVGGQHAGAAHASNTRACICNTSKLAGRTCCVPVSHRWAQTARVPPVRQACVGEDALLSDQPPNPRGTCHVHTDTHAAQPLVCQCAHSCPRSTYVGQAASRTLQLQAPRRATPGSSSLSATQRSRSAAPQRARRPTAQHGIDHAQHVGAARRRPARGHAAGPTPRRPSGEPVDEPAVPHRPALARRSRRALTEPRDLHHQQDR